VADLRDAGVVHEGSERVDLFERRARCVGVGDVRCQDASRTPGGATVCGWHLGGLQLQLQVSHMNTLIGHAQREDAADSGPSRGVSSSTSTDGSALASEVQSGLLDLASFRDSHLLAHPRVVPPDGAQGHLWFSALTPILSLSPDLYQI
jgi:hypothetical protein